MTWTYKNIVEFSIPDDGSSKEIVGQGPANYLILNAGAANLSVVVGGSQKHVLQAHDSYLLQVASTKQIELHQVHGQ